MPAGPEIRVTGLRELSRAFASYNSELKRELTTTLREVGEPVRARAESLATAEIRNIGPRWSRMRLGVTTKVVYVAPRARPTGQGTARPNLAGLLMNQAMQPALDESEPEVLARLDGMLDTLGIKNGF